MMQNATSYPADRIIGRLLQEYLPDFRGNITIAHREDILESYGNNNLRIEALLYKTALPHCYTLLIRKNLLRPEIILCHEFVHLMQYERGDLDLNLVSHEFSWKGKVYPSDFPYNSRPWEDEAFDYQSKLYKFYRNACISR